MRILLNPNATKCLVDCSPVTDGVQAPSWNKTLLLGALLVFSPRQMLVRRLILFFARIRYTTRKHAGRVEYGTHNPSSPLDDPVMLAKQLNSSTP